MSINKVIDINVKYSSKPLENEQDLIEITIDNVKVFITREQAERLYKKLHEQFWNTKRNEKYSNVDLCVSCGKPVPEGKQICYRCERFWKDQEWD